MISKRVLLMDMTRSSVYASLLVLGLVGPMTTAGADVLNDKSKFDIPAQPLTYALIEWSRQADVQVMSDAATLKDLRSVEVKGRLKAKDALQQLLKSTGLGYDLSKNSVVVKQMEMTEAGRAGRSTVGSLSLYEAGSGEGVRPVPQASLRPLGDMLVTGTHILGNEPVGSSLIVIDRQAIERSGFTTVQDLVRSLPQNFGGGASDDSALYSADNTTRGTGMNLRGLGAGATLVLLNGRRLAPSGSQAAFTDLSGIPLVAVARIEVMTDGASAIYGSDAVGGVVNVIMRDDFQGMESQASLGAVTDGALQETNASQLWGTRWPSGHVTLTYDFYHRDALPAAERYQSSDSDLRRWGGDNFSSRLSSPGTVVIGNQSYAIPQTQDGSGLTPDSFFPGVNYENLNEGRDVISEQQRHSGFFSMSQSVGDSLKISADALFSRREIDVNNHGFPATLVVPASNPFRIVPAGANATGRYTVLYNFGDDLGPQRTQASVETLNSSFAATVKLPRHWEFTTSAYYTTENATQIQNNKVSQIELAAVLADPNPVTSFNPYGDGAANNPVTLERIRRSTFFAYDSEVQGVNVVANGGLVDLPGGQMRLAAGVDLREQAFQLRSRGADAFTVRVGPEYKRRVSAAFAEVVAPIVSGDNRLRGVESLQLSLAGRYDDYSDFGSTLNPRLGLEWSPVKGISVHGTWGKSFRAPNLSDVDERNNATSLISLLPDPQSPSGTSPVLFWLGGNSDLTAETADTWSLGVRWDAPSSLGPTVDLSYFDLRFKDRVRAIPGTDAFLYDPVRFAGLVTRSPTSDQRAEVCRRGNFLGNFSSAAGDCLTAPVVAIVDQRFNNTSISTTRGLDLRGSLDIDSDWGLFEAVASISYVLDFSEAQSPTTASVSYLDRVGNQLRFRMRDGISWSKEGFGATASVNYAGGYTDTISAPHRDVGSWTTIDLQLRYEVVPMSSSWLAGCSIFLSAQNLFDTAPPFVNYNAGLGYDIENADLLNRLVSIRVKKIW